METLAILISTVLISNPYNAGATAQIENILNEAIESPVVVEESTEVVQEPVMELIEVGATAYSNPNGTQTASGVYPTANCTLAGKREWIGQSVELYDMDLKYLGTYTFQDVGYGRSTGYGESRLRKGHSLGDIEAGETIDIFFATESEAISWGRRRVYIRWI